MLCFLYCIIGLCSQEEERLVRDLFRGYNKLIRPVQNMTQKVEVAFGLAFIQLINVVSLQKQQHRSHCAKVQKYNRAKQVSNFFLCGLIILTEKKVEMINLLTNALSWLWLLYLLYWNPFFELMKLQSSLIDSKAFSVPIIAVL